MAREHFEQRLFRIFQEAGYLPSDLLSISPEEMVEVAGDHCPQYPRYLDFAGGGGQGAGHAPACPVGL